ncbi:hypothetical protein [Borreliella tanukii]|uniref:hypothetical protein n=1 Tax=Borreliella tanukii TaxID=56146 RepID=UPI003AB97B19
MNKKMRMFIFCAVFALIISCKNYADLKQGVGKKVKQGIENGIEIERKIKQGIEEQVKGFLEKEKGIISDDEIAEKLKEQEQKDKEKEHHQEQAQEQKQEKMQGDDPNNVNQAQILQSSSQDSKPELEVVQQSESGGQQEEQGKEQKEEKKEQKVEQPQVGQESLQAKAQEQTEDEDEEDEKQKKVKDKIKELTEKIDEISKGIDDIKRKKSFVEEMPLNPKEVRDKVTGPILDYFTNSSMNTEEGAQTKKSIYYDWDLAEEEDDDSELKKLLEKLEETRNSLRNTLNVGNQAATVGKTPELKDSVKVSEIESELDSLKSELEKVKKYLEDQSNFETIKEHIENNNDYE